MVLSRVSERTEQADRKAYADAETEAKAAKRGLWKDANPMPPWDFRHNGQAATAPQILAPKAPELMEGVIISNKRSKIYHWPGCPNYNDIAPQNREFFKRKEEAEKAGYAGVRWIV